MDATIATTRSASMQRSRLVEAARRLHALAEQVKTEGACSLPGVSLDYTRLRPLIQRAMAKGFVTKLHGDFVLRGLWFGFDLGIDVSKIKGRRWFRNYSSAEEARPQCGKVGGRQARRRPPRHPEHP